MSAVLPQFQLKDQVAIITGAGKGIGRAIALAFAEAGANVVCAARTEADIEQTAEQARAFGVQALAVKTNSKSERQLNQLVEQALDTFGKINILVNNAGGALPNDALTTSAEQFNADYHFNVTSPFILTQLCVPHMKKAGSGNIINITSAAARYTQPGFTSYGTCKAALTHLTRLMAADFAPDVRVNGIAPGSIFTDSLAQFLDEAGQKKMTELTPMKSLGKPEDIASAALYLASPAARWVTGKIIEVDGGAEVTTWPYS